MKSRWAVVSALIVMVGLAWAGAATSERATTDSATAVTAQSAPVNLASPAAANDPYATAAPISTIGPAERKSCSIFAQDCVVDGGHCGPSGAKCYCLFWPGEGWRCGGGGGS